MKEPDNIDDVLKINKKNEKRGEPGRWSVYSYGVDKDGNPEVEFQYNEEQH